MQPDTRQTPPLEVKEYSELPVADLAPKRKRSPLARIVPIVLALVVIAVILLLVLGHHKTPKQTTAKTATQDQAITSTSGSVTDITSSTKRYDSPNLFLGFNYPTDWSVSDPGSGELRVISPMLELKSANNQVVKARIVMSIQNQQTAIKQFAANTAIAPIASQKLTYKAPTTTQRAQTYLTFVNYAGGSETIDALYITGDNGYTAGQYVPQSDVVEDDPLINISFFGCADTSCSNYGSAIAIATTSWADKNLSGPLINMLQSLQID